VRFSADESYSAPKQCAARDLSMCPGRNRRPSITITYLCRPFDIQGKRGGGTIAKSLNGKAVCGVVRFLPRPSS
jgi:hypothetical protein